ncbi:MAG: BON domain-containing protein [Armatimonadota bacterium]
MPMIFDAAMGQLIRERLQQDKRTAGVTVEINCADGCISLIGEVDSEEQKNTTLFLIEGLSGVRSVMDQIIIRPH